jgi:hypothetical protein
MITVSSKDNVVIDQNQLPNLANLEKQLPLFDSKWQHAEDEWLVTLLAQIAIKNGAWCLVPFGDLLRAARHSRYAFAIGDRADFTTAVNEIVATGDIELVSVMGKWLIFPMRKLYIKPLPELMKTFAGNRGKFRKM